MAFLLQNYSFPATFPAISWNSGLEQAKSTKVVGIVVAGCHFSWKIIRRLSLSGKSKNPIIQYLHSILRNYLNHGFMIRHEFFAHLPWQFFMIFNNQFVIVNYGSYGTVPKQVMNHQIELQNELEHCPDNFNRITLPKKYEISRNIVAHAVGCKPENLVFVDNITEGMSCALRSLLQDFDDDDAVLCLNLNYGSVLKTATIHTKFHDVKLLQLDLKFPINSEDEICNQLKDMFEKHPNIKLAIIDHITSASAVKLPIEKLIKICRQYNVISIIDGAHAPGQIHLNLENLGADIYIGNLHKWYYTPKSCAIMRIDQKWHDIMQPSLVSHGCYGDLHERFRRQGTKNYSAHLTAGFAVGDFMENLGGIDHLHKYITPKVEWAVQLYTKEWGTEELSIPESMKAPYMRIVFLPEIFNSVYGTKGVDADRLIIEMLKEYKIAIFINPVQNRLATRISAQIFSGTAEYYYAARCIKRKAAELQAKFS